MVSKLYVCGHVLFVMVRVMAVLTALGEGTEEIDMTRMKNILNQSIIKVLNVVSCCTSSFSFSPCSPSLSRWSDNLLSSSLAISSASPALGRPITYTTHTLYSTVYTQSIHAYSNTGSSNEVLLDQSPPVVSRLSQQLTITWHLIKICSKLK